MSFFDWILLLVHVALALVVSLDIVIAVSLDMLTSILVVIVFMHFPLRGIYQELPLVHLEVFFTSNLILLSSVSKQLFAISKGELSTKILVLLSFVFFCGILFYHMCDRFIKSYLQEHIRKMF